MKKNLGSTDKIIRVLLAVALVIAFFSGAVTGVLGYVLLAVAGILVVTTFANFCPLYRILGINSCKIKN